MPISDAILSSFKEPLPLIEGEFVIDNSTIELLRCPELYRLRSLRRKETSTPKAGRNFGSAFHAGRAVRYQRCGNKAVTPDDVPFINKAMEDWFRENPQPTDDFRTYAHACAVMAKYNDIYKDEPWDIVNSPKGPLVEQSILLPFAVIDGIQVWYSGKLDLGVDQKGAFSDFDGLWSHDAKTAFQFGQQWEVQMSRDGGQLGYCWAMQEWLGRPVQGYIIDGVRIRKPTLKSKRNEEYGIMDGSLAPIDKTDFMRIPYLVSPETIQEWKENTIELIKLLFHFHRTGTFPRYRWQCVNKYGPCDMIDYCSAPLFARENVLQSSNFTDSTWSPLRKEQE